MPGLAPLCASPSHGLDERPRLFPVGFHIQYACSSIRFESMVSPASRPLERHNWSAEQSTRAGTPTSPVERRGSAPPSRVFEGVLRGHARAFVGRVIPWELRRVFMGIYENEGPLSPREAWPFQSGFLRDRYRLLYLGYCRGISQGYKKDLGV